MKNSTKKSGEKTFGFNEVMSLLESMNDGINVISEQHGGVVSRLDKIDVRLDKVDDRLDTIDDRLDKIDVRLDKVDGRLDKVDGRLGRLENKVDKLQDDMVEVKHELKNKVGRDEFKKLEKRVVKLEQLSFSH